MEFYKKKNPKLSEFITAIESFDYFTMEQFTPRQKQLTVYYEKEMSNPAMTMVNVTNSGGYPIIFDLASSEETFEEYLETFGKGDLEFISLEDYEHEKELFLYYARPLRDFL
jgi:hypothetical protein